jgi:hypothetical protein
MTMTSNTRPPARNPLAAIRSWLKGSAVDDHGREGGARDANPLMAFATESGAPDAGPARESDRKNERRPSSIPPRTIAATLVAAFVSAGAVALIYAKWDQLQAAEKRSGKLTVDSHPGGIAVSVDGLERGKTPLTITLDPGPHKLSLRRGSQERVIPFSLAGGAELAQYVELPVDAPPAAGKITVATDPPGARVRIDGENRGVSPLTVADLVPSEHKVMVTTENGSSERSVLVEPGATVSVVFSLPKTSAPAAGWVALTSPFDVQLLEGSSVVGTGRSSKVMLPAGRHDLEVVNESLEFRDSRSVDVVAGKVTNLRVDPPKGALSANARPWADVIIDGTNVGQTPIANFALPIGTHQVLFRHPQYGERTQTIVVTAKGLNRVAVDLTK